jgi:hypothetical protein
MLLWGADSCERQAAAAASLQGRKECRVLLGLRSRRPPSSSGLQLLLLLRQQRPGVVLLPPRRRCKLLLLQDR